MVIVVSTVSIAVLGARRVRRREDDNGAVQALAAAGHGADRAAAGVVLRPLAEGCAAAVRRAAVGPSSPNYEFVIDNLAINH